MRTRIESDSRTAFDADQASALARELREISGKLTRRLREQAPPGDLTWSQVVALGRLYRDGPATLSALARAENMRSQSMGAIIAPMEEAGLVVGSPDPADGRQTILSLTRKARALVQDTRLAREDWLFRVIQATLSPQEQDELAAALGLLKRIVDG
jgi:DNA-binding MarR family transcriptional regulator